jgi:acetyl-CoA synthetase
MNWETIRKARPPDARTPNLSDYEAARRGFSWAAARSELDGLPDRRGLNIAHEAIDRHAEGPRARQVALRWIAKGGAASEWSYAELREQTARFANVLADLGVAKGERVFGLAGRIPAL